MTSDDFLSYRIYTQEFAYTFGHVTMRCSVEAITTHTILFIQFVRDSIHVSIIRHSLMESRIEYTYLRNIRKNSRNCIHTFQVSRIVKRSQIIASCKSLQHFFVQQYRFAETFASVHHTVTYRINLIQRFDSTIFRMNQCIQDKLYSYCMFRNIFFQYFLFAVRQSQFQERSLQTDFFDTTLCNHFFAGHIEQFIFNR